MRIQEGIRSVDGEYLFRTNKKQKQKKNKNNFKNHNRTAARTNNSNIAVVNWQTLPFLTLIDSLNCENTIVKNTQSYPVFS